ncbi:methionine synthase [Microcoleus sp. FACHB-1515]|uniref:Npun_R2821/Npun_R2822 family protein n=1 Tax=Cyanophyceae TaxID=3028117 RepID=UPI00168905B6|nr:Npun_R2821/Npun_R2822 family protein [Microcoleus sp. FACHB-1515]MBD2091702.1 methionine synthase [Microcoleus sp. FACHB-1515]
MYQGIYITANDRVLDQSTALVNSIRHYDPVVPIILIPYDNVYKETATYLQKYDVSIYANLDLVEELSIAVQRIFGKRFFARPNQFRKQACWFGEFDRFLYIDTDILVFDRIIQTLNYLDQYDFVCADYQHRGGLTNVFDQKIIEDQVFPVDISQQIFNCGFWGSKKGLISKTDLLETFAECAAHPEYFDFSQKVSDQPIINYLILKRIAKRINLVHRSLQPGNWAGSPHFIQQGSVLFDPRSQQPLQYLHWAGIRIEPECPYWQIWQHYRNLSQD